MLRSNNCHDYRCKHNSIANTQTEVSPNNRAGCQDAQCKKNGVKIMKGEIRFGVWVEGQAQGREFQGFKWRHWYVLIQL